MWGFVVDCLQGVSQGACWSSQVCVLVQERRHRDTCLWGCVCQAPGPLLWGVVGASTENGVGVWFGSGEQELPEEAPPLPPSFFPPFRRPFHPSNQLDPRRQALAGSWHPGLQAKLLRD